MAFFIFVLVFIVFLQLYEFYGETHPCMRSNLLVNECSAEAEYRSRNLLMQTQKLSVKGFIT